MISILSSSDKVLVSVGAVLTITQSGWGRTQTLPAAKATKQKNNNRGLARVRTQLGSFCLSIFLFFGAEADE